MNRQQNAQIILSYLKNNLLAGRGGRSLLNILLLFITFTASFYPNSSVYASSDIPAYTSRIWAPGCQAEGSTGYVISEVKSCFQTALEAESIAVLGRCGGLGWTGCEINSISVNGCYLTNPATYVVCTGQITVSHKEGEKTVTTTQEYGPSGADHAYVGGMTPLDEDPDPEGNCESPRESNPFNPLTGTKFHGDEDYKGGTYVPSLSKFYDSRASYINPMYGNEFKNALNGEISRIAASGSGGSGRNALGRALSLGAMPFWQHNYIRTLRPFFSRMMSSRSGSGSSDGSVNLKIGKKQGYALMTAPRPGRDARVFKYSYGDDEYKTFPGYRIGRLVPVAGEFGSFDLHTLDGGIEHYKRFLLQWEQKRGGLRTTYNYHDTSKKLLSVVGPFGHTLSFEYDNLTSYSGRATRVILADGQAINYELSAAGMHIRTIYPDLSEKQYTYVNSKQLSGFIDENGVEKAYTYYPTGHVESSGFADGTDKVSVNYLSDLHSLVTDIKGNTTDYYSANIAYAKRFTQKRYSYYDLASRSYDQYGRLIFLKDEAGYTTNFTFDANHQLSRKVVRAPSTGETETLDYEYTDALIDLPSKISKASIFTGARSETLLTYTDTWNVATLERKGYTPTGELLSRLYNFTYNTSGQLIEVSGPRSDANGILMQASYYECTTGGACGQIKSLINALGQTTTYDAYDANARLKTTTDANGLVTDLTYDLRGRVLSITQSHSNETARTITYTYRPGGQIASTTMPGGYRLDYQYDNHNQVAEIQDNLGNRAVYSYDNKNNRVTDQIYDNQGILVRNISRAYDAHDNVSNINDGGNITQQVHNTIGQLTSETDANNNNADTLRYSLDGKLSMKSISGYFAETKTFDANKNVNLWRTPDTQTDFDYDDFGNLRKEVSNDRGTTTLDYDNAGNMISRTDANAITATYNYDVLNRTTTINYPDASENVQFTYDTCTNGIGRLCSMTDPSGTTNYTYDGFGNVTSQTYNLAEGSFTLGYTYNALNQVTSLTLPDGTIINSNRDSRGNITNMTAVISGNALPLLSNRQHRFDNQLSQQTFGNALIEQRQYNLQGWVENVTLGDSYVTTYDYDANGNLKDQTTSTNTNTEPSTYTYDFGDRLTGHFEQGTLQNRYTYLGFGNRFFGTPSGAIYPSAYPNMSHMRISINGGYRYYTYTPAGQLDHAWGNGPDIVYNYYQNQRLQSVIRDGVTVGTYQYNALNLRTHKTTATGTEITLYDTQGQPVLILNGNGQIQKTLIWADQTPVARLAANTNEVLYLHTDHLNTPRWATNDLGTTVWQWAGEPFGVSPANTDPDNDGLTTEVNLRFPGQVYDQETKLHYNWHRYYDPQLGRYITSDPIGLKGGLNTYGYVGGNPLGFTDMKGLDIDWDGPGSDWPDFDDGPRFPGFNLGDSLSDPNGNLFPGYDPQDGTCTLWIFSSLGDACFPERCQKHDACFDKNKCNVSSWIPTFLGGTKPCNECNSNF